MNRRSILTIAAVMVSGLALLPGGAVRASSVSTPAGCNG